MSEEIRNYLKLLSSPKIDKINLVNTIMQEKNYDELLQIYSHIPNLHRGLFGLSYLRRSSYDNLYSSGYSIEKDIVEYIGVLAFVIEQNKSYLSKFLKLKQEVETYILKSDYPKALQTIHTINKTISYSAWASALEIKILRLGEGISASKSFYNKVYNQKRVTSFFSVCALKTSSIDYPFDNEIEFYNQFISPLESRFQCFLRMHSFPYIQKEIDAQWMFEDFRSSIIDLYLSLRDTFWRLPNDIIETPRFRRYISIIENVTNDALLTKFCIVNGIPHSHPSTQKAVRIRIQKNFANKEYAEVVREGKIYMEDNPLDMSILDLTVKACVMNQEHPEWVDFEGSIWEKLAHNYYYMLCRDDDYEVHLNRIKLICKSLYSIDSCRFIYALVKNIENNTLGSLYDTTWEYSSHYNYADLLHFPKLITIPEYGEFTSVLNDEESLIPEYENTIVLTKSAKEVFEELSNRWKNRAETSYLSSMVASYLFNYYAKHSLLKEAIRFYVDTYLYKKHVSITIQNMEDMVSKLESNGGKMGIPLELSIFYTMIDEPVLKRYITYKHYLKSAGLSRPSELSISGDEKIKYFLSNVADMSVMGLHREFKTREERLKERIRICNNLYDFYGERVFSDEVSSLVKKEEVKKMINRVDDSKIYVDVENIQKNELHDEELLYKLFQEMDDSLQFEDTGIQALQEYMQQLGSPIIFYDIDTATQKYSIFKQVYRGIRNKFLYDPRYGLDFYLSTRIRHGTLVNQLRNHFLEHHLVTNKNMDEYEPNTYWVDEKMGLNGSEREQCLDRFTGFAQTIDSYILAIKDKYVQISTEDRNADNKEAYFNFALTSNNDSGIGGLYTACKKADFQTGSLYIFEYLWQLVDGDLYYLRQELDIIKSKMLDELSDLMSEIYHIVDDQQVVSTLHNEIAACRTELQNDFNIVSKWFVRNANVSFDFNMQNMLDTCLTNMNNVNQNQLKYTVDNKSTSSFLGKYFNDIYDIFHDLLNNVLNYQKKKSKIVDCEIHVVEEDELLHIVISNWIDQDDKEEIQQAISRHKNIDDINYSERVTKEEHSGILKISNIVTNILREKGNNYANSVDDNSFTARITLNKNKLRHEN